MCQIMLNDRSHFGDLVGIFVGAVIAEFFPWPDWTYLKDLKWNKPLPQKLGEDSVSGFWLRFAQDYGAIIHEFDPQLDGL